MSPRPLNSFHLLSSLALALIGALTMTVSCAPQAHDAKGSREHVDAPGNPTADYPNGAVPIVQSKSGVTGGLDGSGGDVPRSSIEQVNNAFKTLRPRLNYLFMRSPDFVTGLGQTLASPANNQTLFSRAVDRSAVLVLAQMLKGNEKLPGAIDLVKSPSLEFSYPETEPCKESPESLTEKDAVVTGTKICVNIKSLRRLPPESLELEVTALMVHELAHVYGFSEEQANALQALVKANPRIFLESEINKAICLDAKLTAASKEERLTEILRHLDKLDLQANGTLFIRMIPPLRLETCMSDPKNYLELICVGEIVDANGVEGAWEEQQSHYQDLDVKVDGRLFAKKSSTPEPIRFCLRMP